MITEKKTQSIKEARRKQMLRQMADNPQKTAGHQTPVNERKYTKKSAFQRKVTENYRRRKRRAKRERRIAAVLVAMITMYCVAVFSEIPVIAKWRTIYIETAMTTKSHQWLAEYFIPGFIIDEVMASTHDALDAQEDLISNWSESIRNNSRGKFVTQSKLDTFYSTYWELDTDSARGYIDEHYDIENGDYENILIEDFDGELGLLTPTGDPIIVIDTANNLIIIDISQGDYHGKLAIVKDASQIDVAKSKNFGSFGQEVAEFGEENGAILAINASRFRDIGGHGNGGTVKGSLVLEGEEYGSPQKGYWRFAGFKDDNLLNICSYPKKEIKDYRWGLEVYPALIVNGENVIDNTLGMGIQPRTAIGQSASGDFMLLVIDGRQVGYSLGCTVADCAEVLTEYQAYQGMNLDGGSSTVMWYKGQLITKPCSVSGRGRYMPDAILVKPAQEKE